MDDDGFASALLFWHGLSVSNKEMVLGAVSQLPDDASMEEISRKVEFLAGLKEAIKQADRGEGASIDEARRLEKEWVRK